MLRLRFTAVLLLQVLAAWVFFSGFILPRAVREDVAAARPADVDEARGWYGDRKVVMVIIDALRHDMVVGPSAKLSSLRNTGRVLLSESPTTTAQRLKAMTTGSIPAFIELGSAFDSDAVTQDNLIHQLHTHGRTTAVFGDDTWLALYPDHLWTTAHVFPSFNVWDLDTVDHGIMSRMGEVYVSGGGAPQRLKHDLTVLHFLGVDHAGHRYGPRHREMERKAREVDGFLDELIGNLSRLDADERVCLMVLGDHGMTEDGQHGGGTELEVTTVLHVREFPAAAVFSREGVVPPAETWAGGAPMEQVDLVPTLAAVLGVPFPLGNLGRVDRGVLAHLMAATPAGGAATPASHAEVVELERYLRVLLRNAEQVVASVAHELPNVGHLRDDIERLKDRVARLLTHAPTSRDAALATTVGVFLEEGTKIAGHLEAAIASAASAARAEWASMKPTLLYLAVFLSLVPLYILWGADNVEAIPTWRSIAMWGGTLLPAVVQAVALTSNSYVVTEDQLAPYLLSCMLLAAALHARTLPLFGAMVAVRVLPWLLARPMRRFGTHHLHDAATPVHDVASLSDWVVKVGVPVALLVGLQLRGVSSRDELHGGGSGKTPRTTPPTAHPHPPWGTAPAEILRKLLPPASARRGSGGATAVLVPFLLLGIHTLCKLLPGARAAENTAALLCFAACGVLRNMWCAAALITGPQGIGVWLVTMYVSDCIAGAPPAVGEGVRGVMLHLLSWVTFFASGHQTVLSAIDFGSAFVGFDVLHHTAHGAAMVGFNTFAGFLLPVDRGVSCVAAASCAFTGALFAAALHRMHLMVWEVFVPRLLFGAVITPITTLAAAVTAPRQRGV